MRERDRQGGVERATGYGIMMLPGPTCGPASPTSRREVGQPQGYAPYGVVPPVLPVPPVWPHACAFALARMRECKPAEGPSLAAPENSLAGF